MKDRGKNLLYFDLNQRFPAEVTDHVHKYLHFLEVVWPSALELVKFQQGDSDKDFMSDFMQVVWFYLVEWVLLAEDVHFSHDIEKHTGFYLGPPNEKQTRIVCEDVKLKYVMTAKWEGPLKDPLTDEVIPSDSRWSVFTFEHFDSLTKRKPPIKPPFDLVKLYGWDSKLWRTAFVKDVRFFVENAQQDNSSKSGRQT